jgi:hypothetical protein
MASELKRGTTDSHTDCRYTVTTTVEVSPHRALTVIVHRTASPASNGMARSATQGIRHHRPGHYPCQL